jgi:hypothetical protein
VSTHFDPRPRGDPDDEAPPSSDKSLPRELPPELAALPPGELAEAFEAALLFAARRLKSLPRARVLVSDVYTKLTRTRRWDPARGPLLRHVLGAVRSELSNQNTSKAPERESEAAEGFHREVRPDRVESPEELQLDHGEAARRRERAARELEQLAERVANLPVASAILRLQADEGMHKPAELAAALNVPQREIYRALEMLRYHLKKIREVR